jgi:hypothetical protein
MIAHLQDSFSNRKPDSTRPGTVPQTLWLRFIELWLSGVLAAFLFIRILGSDTARHILSQIAPHVR